MYFKDLAQEKEKTLMEGFYIKYFNTTGLTVGHIRIDKGKELPEHSHPQEQITNVISGELQLTIDGETKVMKAGEVAIIPSEVKHSGKALTDCYVIDVFNPPRKDFEQLK